MPEAPQAPGRRRVIVTWAGALAAMAVVAALALFAALYLHAAFLHARVVNTDMESTDQSAYMNYARKIHDTGYDYVGDRNRMPLYPFLLSLLYRDGMDPPQFFERAKTFNILLSVGLLGGLLMAFVRYLPVLPAIVLMLVTAFTLFVYRAPYVQCELLYYSLVFIGFLLACETLHEPGWKTAAATGAVLGLAHLTKASTPPGIAAFLLIAVVASLRRPADLRRAAAAALTLVCFVGLLFPYLSTSKRLFGRYFYNVNSTFYMWYDTRDEVFAGTRAHGDRQGWPNLPAEQIPGPGKYLREHTVGQILSRVTRGLAAEWNSAWRGYGYLKYLLLYGLFALGAMAWKPKVGLALARERLWVALFALVYLVAYLLLYAWISQIHAGLPRLILSMFLPLAFCLV